MTRALIIGGVALAAAIAAGVWLLPDTAPETPSPRVARPDPAAGSRHPAADRGRIAVIDVGAAAAVPGPWVALLEVELAARGFELVERQRMRELLREQTVSLSGDEHDPAWAVRAGELVHADALVLLAAAAPEEPDGPVPTRLRVLDAHHGLKAWDSALTLKPGDASLEAAAADTATRIAERLAAIHSEADAGVLVGISGFRSEEVSRNWDWLSESLADQLERAFAGDGRFVLLERQRVRELGAERDLGPGLPPALRASAVLIEGTYRLDRAAGPDAVEVRARGRGSRSFEVTATGSLRDPAALAQKLQAAIADRAAGGAAGRSMPAAAEARLLLEEGRTYLRMNEPRRAIPPLEAAAALRPDDLEPVMLILQATPRAFLQPSGDKWGLGPAARPAGDPSIARPNLALSLANLGRIERVLDAVARGRPPRGRDDGPDAWVAACAGALEHVTASDRGVTHAEWRESATMRADAARQLLPKFDRALGERRDGAQAAYRTRLVSLHRLWSPRAADYFTAVRAETDRWSKLNLSEATHDLPTVPSKSTAGGTPFGWDGNEKPELDAAYVAFLDDLAKHEDPLVRAAAEAAHVRVLALERVKPDLPGANAHLRGFLAALAEAAPGRELRGLELRVSDALGTKRETGRRHAWTADGGEAAGLLSDLVRRGFRGEKGFEPFVFAGEMALDLWEAEGKTEEAAALLRELIAAAGRSDHGKTVLQGLIGRFQVAHPEILLVPTPTLTLDAELVLVRDKLPERFATLPAYTDPVEYELGALIVKHGVVAAAVNRFVSYSIEPGSILPPYDVATEVSLIRLDPGSLEPLSCVTAPTQPRYRRSANRTSWDVDQEGNVVLGLPGGGVAFFDTDGKTVKRWTIEHGLPSDNVTSIAMLEGKAYAAVGSAHTAPDTGLMEIDLADGKGEMIVSGRAGDPGAAGPVFTRLRADPPRRRLIVWTRRDANAPGDDARVFDAAKRAFGSVGRDDPLDAEITPNADPRLRWLTTACRVYPEGGGVMIEAGYVCVGRVSGGANDLVLLRPGDAEPVRLRGEGVPRPHAKHQPHSEAAALGDGVLLMMPEKLVMLRGLSGEPEPAPARRVDLKTLSQVVAHGDAAWLARVLSPDTELTQRGEFDQTLLHSAHDPGVAAILIDRGLRVDERTGPKQQTPLHWQCYRNRPPAIVAFLLARGADVNARDHAGRTPLHLAVMVPHPSEANLPGIIEALVRSGADLAARDNDGATPLKLAASEAARDLLRKHGAKE